MNEEQRTIALVIESLVVGGAERICIDIAKCLVCANYQVDLILFKFEGELLKQIPDSVALHVLGLRRKKSEHTIECPIAKEDINWVALQSTDLIRYSDFFRYVVANWPFEYSRKIPHRRGRLVRYANSFASYLKRSNPDLVFAIMPRAMFVSLIGREISNCLIPVICSLHGAISQAMHSHLQIYNALLQKADWVHTVSEDMLHELCAHNLFSARKSTAIYNFVDSCRVRRLAESPTGHPWFDSKEKFEQKIILSVGRLTDQKHYSLLIDSFARLPKSENLKLVILGEGPLRHDLQSQSNRLGLSRLVSLPGWTANPYAFMRRADLFILSSIYEGLPIVLIEALACGCKIVSTDCPTGPREILDQGGGGFGTLVPVDDEVEMSTAILEALNSESDPGKLMSRAQEFSQKRFLSLFEEMIENVITSKKLNHR